MRIYLAHPDGRIEVAECEASATRLEARRFVRVSAELHLKIWRLKYLRRLKEMQSTVVVYETAPLKAVSGWTHYGIDGKEIKQ
jgi:hypothetical protein